MSPIHHHPGEDLLWDYYRGAASPGLALVVRTHLEACAACRADLRMFDGIGAAMMAQAESVAMSDNALDLALARIERPIERPEAAAPVPEKAEVRQPAFLEGFELPDSLMAFIVKDRYWAAPGVWMAPVEVGPQPKGERTYLMYVRTGMTMPQHTHRGLEATVVLKGRFSDHNGEYRVGDMAVCTPDDSHAPAISADGDCLCLIWQDATIIPQTWLGRLLQPLARI